MKHPERFVLLDLEGARAERVAVTNKTSFGSEEPSKELLKALVKHLKDICLVFLNVKGVI